jgi:cytochrome c
MEPPPLTPQEMRSVGAYLWTVQYFERAGNARRGSRLWSSKGCAGCHEGSGAPKLAGRGLNSISIIAALWRHGPTMLAEMERKQVRWPEFRGGEMADLLAFLEEKGL